MEAGRADTARVLVEFVSAGGRDETEMKNLTDVDRLMSRSRTASRWSTRYCTCVRPGVAEPD